MIVPKTSILAEPPVAVVDKVVDRRNTRTVAEAYLKFLYSEAAQEIAVKHHYRPRLATVAAKHLDTFPKLELAQIDDSFGGWQKAQAAHFADGASFDQIYQHGH